jgi:uncharacterized membrane-anchored protein YhcB (DUF1043 family)
MTAWAIISTIATIIGVILGIARLVAARRKAKVDREVGELKTRNDALLEALGAGKERIATDAAVINLPDGDADARLDKWMRD